MTEDRFFCHIFQEQDMIRINNDWKFIYTWDDDFLNDISSGEDIRLPHNVGDIPLHYASPDIYSTVCGYGRELQILEEYAGKRLFLQFDGAAHIAEVFVNGTCAGKHFGGYTAFRVEVTGFIHSGLNTVAVKLDCTENPLIPPFGHAIDYLTYGGLYRDVWLDVRDKLFIEDIFIHTVSESSVRAEISCSGVPDSCLIKLTGPDGRSAVQSEFAPASEKITADLEVTDALLWSPDSPQLYRCQVSIKGSVNGRSCSDVQEVSFGIRTAEFKSDGFYLNGEKTFIRGLNRHQSFPYVGYAATERLQRFDAGVLKSELGCNAVRTSHYPQSQYFVDECDRLGLFVFTEIPGWQHLGNEEWKDHALEILREMIIQYRNHPSVILWGVRINESVDDDDLYARTNKLAHELDSSRQTSGVRYLEKSSLLEDVYAFNDFSHDGKSPGCRKKKDITPDMNKGYLISECNGHMFPTKPYDSWSHRQEQALRHARIMDAAMAEGNIAGMFGWCMVDYPTHKDFGSGDRVCYHGVMDAFRNPKTAAYFYASQSEERPILEIGSSFDIGDYPAGSKGDIYAFTNADDIKLYKNDRYVGSFSGSQFNALSHGPILIDDIIGELINDEEGFDPKEAALVKYLLLSAEKHGFDHMPFADKMKLLHAHFRYGLSFEQGYALYGKYFGSWGDASVIWRFDAVKDGQVVCSVIRSPGNELHAEASAASTDLTEGDCYDMSIVRIIIKDENGNTAPYAQIPLKLEAGGAIELAGPSTVTAEGGMCGTIVRTCGLTGKGSLKVSSDHTETVVIDFKVN